MRKNLKALVAAFSFIVAALVALPTVAANRVTVYSAQVPSSNQTNQQMRNDRIALGTWILHALDLQSSGAGTYADLSVTPGTGLYVVVAPAIGNTFGAIYQVAQDDPGSIPASPLPSPSPFPQLTPDSTLIVVQAFQAATTAPLGPLTAPGSNSVYWLVEAKVQTVAALPTPLQFLNPYGVPVSNTVNSVTQDQIVYQIKSGSSAASPTPVPADTGYIPVANILVPSGTSQITSLMIQQTGDAAPFQGFATSGGGGGGASPLPTFAAVAPIVVSTSSSVVQYSCGTCNEPGSNYAPTILAEAQMTHFWPFTDSPAACTTIADDVSAGATSAPSPVPLTEVVPTTAPSPLIGCQTAPLIKDGTTAGQFPGSFACISGVTCSGYYPTSYWDWPQSVLPASGPFTIEAVVECVGTYQSNASWNVIWNWPYSGGYGDLLLCLPPALEVGIPGSGLVPISSIGAAPVLIDDTWDGTTHRWYVNGTLVYGTTTAPQYPNADGAIGEDVVNGGRGLDGRMQYLAIYSRALSSGNVKAHFLASGI